MHLSVITFNNTAQQVVPLTEIMQFKEPLIEAKGQTALGEALQLLKDCIKREVRPNTAEQKGDWKLFAFIFTDGYPTDETLLYQELQDMKFLNETNIIACAAGAKADTNLLKKNYK